MAAKTAAETGSLPLPSQQQELAEEGGEVGAVVDHDSEVEDSEEVSEASTSDMVERAADDPIDPTNDMEDVLLYEKMRMVDSVLASRVFEVNVTRLPMLLPFFKEYEKARRYNLEGVKMGDYDSSCNRYYEDSLSMAGDFDKGHYEEKEYLYKVKYRNKTGELAGPLCDEGAKYGCCSARNVDDFCLCQMDGEKDVLELLESRAGELSSEWLKLNMQIGRGFLRHKTSEAEDLRKKFRKILPQLGVTDSKMLKRLSFMKNFIYLPPEGMLMWHTNRHDNNNVPYRLYIISVDKDGESGFKYLLPDGKVIDVPDFHGSVRLFSNTHEDAETGEKGHLWHTVYSKSAHRHSIGFEIPPEQIVALLDSCDGCWDDLLSLRSSL